MGTMAYMDRALIRKKLREMMERLYADIPHFAKAAKIPDANVRSYITERGTTLPGLPALDKWLRACGTSAGKFFTELEAEEKGKVARTATDELIEAFTVVVQSDPDAARDLLMLAGRLARQQKPSKKHK